LKMEQISKGQGGWENPRGQGHNEGKQRHSRGGVLTTAREEPWGSSGIAKCLGGNRMNCM